MLAAPKAPQSFAFSHAGIHGSCTSFFPLDQVRGSHQNLINLSKLGSDDKL